MERIEQLFGLDKNHLVTLEFNRLDFWLFFLLVFLFFSFLYKHRAAKSVFIIAVSLFFYYKTSGLFVLLLFGGTIWNFLLGRAISRNDDEKKRKRFLVSGLMLNILLLIYFKYGLFFTESFNAMFQTDYQILNQFALWGNQVFGQGTFLETLYAAAGFSFITFQGITYLVDIHRKEVEPVKTWYDYAFYATFFPSVVMGPINRARDFIPQLYKPYVLDKEGFGWAIAQIIKGLVKKIVLADFVAANFVNKVMDAPHEFPGFVGIVAMWAYSLFIYGEFSGLTDISNGIARLLGFQMYKNFDSPYKAISVADFWRRWHRSLGTFFREYLYIPLGGNKTGGLGSYILIGVIMLFLIFITRWYGLIYLYAGIIVLYLLLVYLFPAFKRYVHRDINLLIVMVIGGLWHGPTANYVMWGTMNGVALVLYNYWRKISPYEDKQNLGVRFWRIFLTFNFITFTRIWFRLTEDGQPMDFLNHLIGNFDFSWDKFATMCQVYAPALIVIVAGFIIHWLPKKMKESGELWFGRWPVYVQALAVCVVVILVYQAVSGVPNRPVYWNY